MRNLYFVTGNKNKLVEARKVIPGIESVNLDLPEIQDIDPRKVIEAKLRKAVESVDGDIFIEDVSFELECLNGFPGPFIKWMLGTAGRDKIVEICQKLGNDNAVARATIGLAKDGKLYFFEGLVKGKIVPKRGENGFGFDPIFQPEGYDKTFAEMSPEEKNAISHRGRALEEMKKFLKGATNHFN
ncbi:MAG: RdgB/HAM1 family non-canonical purine NTP pyrophosphatase [Candidatus Micrarchaeota archaeon]|nr:RdgB/HAM1 family non-canonical purine NTP pyrophosphatase [Candidatus Micrarchaeota archaeon]